ncbi:MAG TPA: hypothetical protein VMQ40_04765 [Acidimicrobiales bacterium]|nr:hypothetical protein [Acidimicrobiales bacterium]
MTTGLRARPGIPDDVRTAIDAAIEQLVAASPSAAPAPATWRFSGRWFSAHPIRGRSRPG